MAFVRRIGRPLGAMAEAILFELSKHPMTAAQLMLSLKVTSKVVTYTCHRLLHRGQIRIVERVRVQGCNKPVNRYALVRSINPQKTHDIVWGN